MSILTAALAGRYTIQGELGRGGMARVYLAHDTRHDRDVAIKVFDPQLSAMLGGERFLREIRITAQLTHPNIIPLLDSGQAQDLLFYVTPYAPDGSLRARLTRERQLPLRDALRIAREVADALDAAHRAGILHRDIKPENVLFISGHAVLCDFGIARALATTANDSLTQTGISLGTPAYMSPEQALAMPNVDARTDIYALGCVLYEMLSGDPPFTGSNPQRVIAQHASSAVPSIRLARAVVPDSVERVVERALAKSPADRFASAADLRDAIDRVLEPVDDSAVGVGNHRRGSQHLLVAAACVASLIAGGAWAWHHRGPTIGRDASIATRVAVLPMATLGADPQDRYFSEAMTDELISTLSNIAGLRVIARSSVLAYADGKRSVKEIASRLNVGSVIESTSQKAGDRLHITIRLVDASSEEERWSERYDRVASVANVVDVERDVSMRVAQALRIKLFPQEWQRVAKRPTENYDAYELYVRGRALWNERRNQPGEAAAYDTLAKMFRRSIALDSTFAEAHAALARVYIAQVFNAGPSTELREHAAAEIARALALDSGSAEAYYARGDLAYTREEGWRLEDALRDYRRALALKPNDADVHGALGTLLFHVGLLEQARRELETTLTLDPANRFVPPRIGRVMWYGQRYDSALALDQRRPGSLFPYERALVLGYIGRARDGLAVLDSIGRGEDGSDAAAARAVLLARLGQSADTSIQRAITAGQAASHFHHAEFAIASASALLGRRDDALHWLERMANDGMPCYDLIAGDPSFSALRADPRFKAFMDAERLRHERLRAILDES